MVLAGFWENDGTVDRYLIPTGYERTLPPGVQLTVRARRRALASRATGRVLDLGGADSHRGLWGTTPHVTDVVRVADTETSLDRLIARDASFDTVFSVFQLASAPSLPGALDRIAALLAPSGRLLFLEPGRQTGVGARAQRLAAVPVAVTLGWHPDRDIPSELRSAGLSVIDLERHRSRTSQWWIRRLVEGVAHHMPAGSRIAG